MPEIHIMNTGKTLKYNSGDSLLQVLLENQVFVNNPCNGKGSCGKCKVRVLKGNLDEITETEHKSLKTEEIEKGIRLSCLVNPQEDLTLELFQEEGNHDILTTGHIPEFEFRPSITKKVFYIEKPDLQNQISFEDSICKALDIKHMDLEILQSAEIFEGVATGVFSDENLIAIEKGDTSDKIHGVAVDIGTTTVVTSLVDMISGKELASASVINPQKKFGLDVLTRITYQIENPECAAKNLQDEIVSSINDMITGICREKNIERNSIYEVSVAANSTMMHFLLGIDATPIGKSPYAPVFLKSKHIRAADIGLDFGRGTRLYCLPAVSAYIGADIVAGAYVCELHTSKQNVLFVDIGTNGEMVLSKQGSLISCSCAAGPALEGMNISCGMRAAEGAIEDVTITENGIDLKTIGNHEAAGICGSGILAVIRELVRTGIVKRDGGFIKKEKLEEYDYRGSLIKTDGKKRELILKKAPEPLYITQSDVRQVQLAKGALLSGFYALLKKGGIEMEILDKVVIAGQFGSHLPAESLTGTGILPEGVSSKLTYVGNSSKTGAYMALMSRFVKDELEELAQRIDYMELGASEGYEKLFTSCLRF